MTDANFKNAGYALMIEENADEKLTSVKKTYAPVAFGSKTFSPSQIKMSIYAKEFLAIYFAFMEYSHILWGSTKPVIVLTDNKSITRFFQTKIIPPALWNACDFVLQFNFTIVHVPGRMNTAADLLSRLDLDPKEKVQLLIRDDIQTTPIEVHIQSSNVAEEEQFYFLPEDEIETEEQIWERKQRARKKIRENDTPQTPGEEINNNTTHPEKTTVVFQTEITRRTQNPEENERPLHRDMRHQQDRDNVLRNYKLRLLKEPYDEHLMATDHRALQYTAKESRIILKDGLLYRQYFGETGAVKYRQVLLPEQLVDSFIEAHHGSHDKHPGISKVIQPCREKYYYPGLAAKIAKHINQCMKCMQTTRTDNRLLTQPMIDTSKLALGPEDALKVDIVPFDEPSNGLTAIVTAMDIFSRYLFTYCVTKIDAKTIARVLVDIMTRHAYLPTTIKTDKGTQFMSEVVADTTSVLGIQLRHATTKPAQTIGILERCHASLKEALKISTGERRTMWHQFVPTATLNYNTTYHSAIGCEPSRVFHGRIPYNVLELKFGLKQNQKTNPTTDIGEEVVQKTRMIHESVSKHLLHSYIRYKQYYDKKAAAHPLTANDYCYALHPQANNQGSKLSFREFLWTGPFVIVKTLPNKNYLIRKLQTNKTQILHRIRLKPCPTKDRLPDIQVQTKDFQQYNDVEILHDDLYALAWQSGFEHFVMTPEHNTNNEPTIISTDSEDNLQNVTQDADPDAFPENQPDQQETQPEPDPNPEPSSPRKGKYNLRSNPSSNWKSDYAYYDSVVVDTSG